MNFILLNRSLHHMLFISNWGLTLAIFGLLILMISLSLILYFRDYLGVYKSPKFVLIFAIPGLCYGEYMIWQIVLADIDGIHRLVWPDPALIYMFIGYSLLLVGLGLTIILYGKQWWIRQHFAFRKVWGPILTLGKNNSSLLSISWYNLSQVGEKDIIRIVSPENYFKFEERPFNPSMHALIAQLHSIDLIPINSTLSTQKIALKYQIPGDNHIYSVDSQFLQNPPNSLSIMVLGDLHAGGDVILPFVNCLKNDITHSSFVLTLGDIVSNAQSMSQWKTYFGQFQDLLPRIPFVYLPGNHDGYSKLRCKMWKTILNQPYYDESDGGYFNFTQNGSHFVLLDNYNKKGQFVGFSDKQIAWLTAELKKAQENSLIRHVFLCLHNPPFSTGNDGCNPELGPILLSLISKYTKIRAILSGHAHFYQRFTMLVKNNADSRNVHFLILGGGGKLSTEVLSKRAPIPYRWSSDGKISAPIFTPQGGYQKIRNDEFIAKYHQKSVLSHNFMQLSIHGDTIQYNIFDWKNLLLDQF